MVHIVQIEQLGPCSVPAPNIFCQDNLVLCAVLQATNFSVLCQPAGAHLPVTWDSDLICELKRK